jgi:predicted flavoprotein YhiN
LDLLPDLTEAAVAARLARARRGDTVAQRLRKLGLSPVVCALVQEWARPLPDDLAPLLKSLPVPLAGPRPMDEAISSAGGIAHAGLTEGLELRALPRVFACGEMLDWEAPTGGYLLTACLATGLWAGRAAAQVTAAP